VTCPGAIAVSDPKLGNYSGPEFCFFLYAPREQELRQLLSRGQGESEAYSFVDTVGRERAAFIKQYFPVERPNRSLYHAMINTLARKG